MEEDEEYELENEERDFDLPAGQSKPKQQDLREMSEDELLQLFLNDNKLVDVVRSIKKID